MTREKLLDMMVAKPVPLGLFRDRKDGRLYQTHYFGMGEWFAIDAYKLTALVDDLLRDGDIVQTERLVGCPEMRLIKRGGVVETVRTSTQRIGYAFEIRPRQSNSL